MVVATQAVQRELSAAGVAADAGQNLQRVVRIADAAGAGVGCADAKQRKIVQLADRDVVAHLAGFRFEHRSFGANGHSIAGVTDLQGNVFPQSLQRREGEIVYGCKS